MLVERGGMERTILKTWSQRLRSFALAGLLAVAAACPASALELPRDKDAFESYFDEREREFLIHLGEYNDRVGLAPNEVGPTKVANLSWKFHEVRGDSLFLIIYFDSSTEWWHAKTYRGLLELKLQGDKLVIVDHAPLPKTGGRLGGFVGDQGTGCLYNQYAAKPCLDAKRLLDDFAEAHGLPVDPQTAIILQAYKHNNKAEGDRLMAEARGLPPPSSRSAFALQDEVRGMNLGAAAIAGSEISCDLDLLGPRPCPDVVQHYQSFVARHGLPDNQRIAWMFTAYAEGDFKTADAIYASSKGLPVPAYAYRASALSDEVAATGLSDAREGSETEPCQHNPYAVRPCLDSVRHWRNFAARYQLADTPDNARILQAYAEGNDRKGDQLFANAKGVTLEQFLAAAGVPTQRFVVEIYP